MIKLSNARGFSFIALCMILVAEFAYNSFAPELEMTKEGLIANNINYVNWIVVYNCSLYFALFVIGLECALAVELKLNKWLFVILAAIFLAYSVIEYSLRNLPILEFIKGLEDRIGTNWILIIAIIAIVLTSFGIWHKDLRQLLHRL